MEEEREPEEGNYARTQPARVSRIARRPGVHISGPSSPGFSDMQLRKRNNKVSLKEISDEDDGEEELEEEGDEEEDENEEEEDPDAEQDVDVEEEDGEDDEGDDADEEEEAQIDVEGDEEMEEDTAQPPTAKLKIKLKLPVIPSSTSNSATPVPEETLTRTAASSKRSAVARTRRRIQDEDSDDEESEEAGPSRSTRPMTSRQAVLANVVDPSHVSLDGDLADPNILDRKPNPRKKQLNETELALRREETARKRKNLSEKKLEDEKLETINRLLRKQSKPRGARKGGVGGGGTSGGATPVRGGKRGGAAARGGRGGRGGGTARSAIETAKASTAGSEAGDEEGTNHTEGDANDEEGVEGEDDEAEEVDLASGSGSGPYEEVPQVPMFRWISTSRKAKVEEAVESSNAMEVDGPQEPVKPEQSDVQIMEVDSQKPEEDKKMTLSFSVPAGFLSEPSLVQPLYTPPPPRPPQNCAVADCTSPRKYRLVSDWTIGACGIGHLKVLETEAKSNMAVV